jgi:hypothetical protein
MIVYMNLNGQANKKNLEKSAMMFNKPILSIFSLFALFCVIALSDVLVMHPLSLTLSILAFVHVSILGSSVSDPDPDPRGPK